ncbi:MAG: maleylpyruvate isomerase family mycothiol-dependent enzyme [Actinomycetia bacterium]|nr:maleylpyruvate isomerase family mycothiol-dependent enzyme [Actinomycetes bacterium]
MAAKPTPTELVDIVEDVLTHTLALGRQLSEEEADTATDCPGWTVRDQFSHIVGLGQLLEGAAAPEIDLPALEHVSSDLDRFMERPVHVRRGLPLVAIVDELAGFMPRRLAHLRSLADQDHDPDVNSPLGDPRPFSKVIPIHITDIWSHETDIRRGVGREPRMDCGAGRHCLAQTLRAWPILVSRAVEGIDAEVVATVEGGDIGVGDTSTITLGAGGPTATLAGSAAALVRAGFGRGSLDERLADLRFEGDQAVLDAIVPHLAFTP